MLSYRKLAMRVLGRPLHTGRIDSPRPASQRAAAFVLTAAMLITLAAPAFAGTWYIEDGNITVKAGKTEGTNKVSQGETTDEKDTDTVITNRDKDTASSHTVTINANGKNDKVEVTLKDVNIEANSGPALTSKGDVTLTLKGENHLTGGNGGRYGGSGITSNGSLTITGGENDSLTAQGGSSADGGSGSYGGDGIGSSSGGLTISGGTVNATGRDGKDGYGGGGIWSGSGGLTISGGTVTANGGNGGNGGDGICSSGIDLSGSLELTAKAGSPSGRVLSQNGDELDLNTIKDKLGPGAKVTTTDANGKVNQVSIPRPVESEKPVIPEESSSSSDGGSATPSAPASPLPGLTVTDKDGQRISYTSIRGNNVLSIRAGRFTASLRVSLAALRQLRAEGIDTITFRTVLCSTTLSVDELLAIGGEDTEVVLIHHIRSSTLTVGGKAV